jgi:hypothetical protein
MKSLSLSLSLSLCARAATSKDGCFAKYNLKINPLHPSEKKWLYYFKPRRFTLLKSYSPALRLRRGPSFLRRCLARKQQLRSTLVGRSQSFISPMIGGYFCKMTFSRETNSYYTPFRGIVIPHFKEYLFKELKNSPN